MKCDGEFFECELTPTGLRAVPNEDPNLRGKIDYVHYNYICKEEIS